MNTFENRHYLRKLHIAILIVSSFFMILIAEITLRNISQYSPQIKFLTYNPYQVTDFDRIVDWKTLHASTQDSFLPGYNYKGFVTNSHGFLFSELPYDKKSGEFRILLLGDSFAVGVVPYKDHFFQVLKTKLSERHPFSIEAINLGIAATGTGIYRKAFEIEGVRYKPDVVILSFYVGNDFWVDDNNRNNLNRNLTAPDNGLLKILYTSKLFSLAFNEFKKSQFTYKSDWQRLAQNEAPSVLGVFSEENVSYNPFRPSMVKEEYLYATRYIPYLFFKNSVAYSNFKSIQEDLLSIKNLADSINAKFLVLIMPAELQVNEQLREEVMQKINMDSSGVDIFLPQQKIIQFFQSHKIQYIDLLPLFLQSSSPSALYQPLDTHINTFGNQLVADSLFDYFMSQYSL